MARVRLRIGDAEIEIDSRDFYVDNDTLPQVIADLSARLQECSARVVPEPTFGADITQTYEKNMDYLQMLRDAEVHEPEFTAPTVITAEELPGKIEGLEMDGFFSKPRTVSETVEQLLQHGWIASPLDTSKALSKMAFNRELTKSSEEKKTFYYKQTPLIN